MCAALPQNTHPKRTRALLVQVIVVIKWYFRYVRLPHRRSPTSLPPCSARSAGPLRCALYMGSTSPDPNPPLRLYLPLSAPKRVVASPLIIVRKSIYHACI